MPESGVTKHSYFLCQFINPARGHEGERCDCYDTPSQKRTTLAKQRLLRLRANRTVNQASTSGTTESAVASDLVVTRGIFTLKNTFDITNHVRCFNHTIQLSGKALIKPLTVGMG